MHSLWDEVVITDANREAFELVRTAFDQRPEPRLVWIYGPAGSGKTTAVGARARERDLLSPKRAIHVHAQEIMVFIELAMHSDGEQGAPMLERIGTTDVLFLDSFDVFFERGEENIIIASQLLAARTAMGLDTFIVSDKAPEEFDLALMEGAADPFARVEVSLLDEEGCKTLARTLYDANVADESPLKLDDSALDYIAEQQREDVNAVRNILRYLQTEVEFDVAETLTAQRVQELLN